jgi:hypothetical protein
VGEDDVDSSRDVNVVRRPGWSLGEVAVRVFEEVRTVLERIRCVIVQVVEARNIQDVTFEGHELVVKVSWKMGDV